MSSASILPDGFGPFAQFRLDHAAVRERLDVLDAWLARGSGAPASDALPELVGHLHRQFATHMAAEDAVLFPAVADAFPACRGTLAQLQADHAELRSMLAAIARWAPEASGADPGGHARVALRDFIDLLRLHIHREEVAVFDVATRALSPAEIEALATRLGEFLDPRRPPVSPRPPPKGNPS